MAPSIDEILLTRDPLRVSPASLAETDGAVVDFLGVVRRWENDEPIAGLDYEAHPEMAEHQFRKLVQTAHAQFAVARVTLHHRLGFVPVAEPSLFVRVSAKHRGAALSACAWIIDELKRVAPIWKNPVAKLEALQP